MIFILIQHIQYNNPNKINSKNKIKSKKNQSFILYFFKESSNNIALNNDLSYLITYIQEITKSRTGNF